MQLELFPDFPRLLASALPTIHDWSQDWKLFDYPTEDNENMAQSKKQADTILYLNIVLETVLKRMKQDYFIGADVFVYFTRKERVLKAPGKYAYESVQYSSSPDVFLAMGNGLQSEAEPESFIREKVLEQTEDIPPRMIAIEILSKSNYKDKNDQKKRFKFYNELGVDEYIVVHTKPEMSFEVYWRLGDTLQPVMFYEKHKYDCPLLNVGFQIDKKVIGKTKKGKDISKQYLSKFNKYDTELEMREEAEQKAEEIAQRLEIITETLQEERQERIKAKQEHEEEKKALIEAIQQKAFAFVEAEIAREKERKEEETALKEEEMALAEAKRARIEEQKARLEAEEKLRLALREIAELRGVLKNEESLA
jgi:Uma2 family endonuclease